MDAFTLAETVERAVAPRCIEAGVEPDTLGVRRDAGDDLVGDVEDATMLTSKCSVNEFKMAGCRGS